VLQKDHILSVDQQSPCLLRWLKEQCGCRFDEPERIKPRFDESIPTVGGVFSTLEDARLVGGGDGVVRQLPRPGIIGQVYLVD
jgi:hypothetical protein